MSSEGENKVAVGQPTKRAVNETFVSKPCPDCGKGCCDIDRDGKCVGNCRRAPATHAREVAITKRLFAKDVLQ